MRCGSRKNAIAPERLSNHVPVETTARLQKYVHYLASILAAPTSYQASSCFGDHNYTAVKPDKVSHYV